MDVYVGVEVCLHALFIVALYICECLAARVGHFAKVAFGLEA
jgi:hypothetical protein